MPSGRPIYIQSVLDGTEVGFRVANLSTGGATLICPETAKTFQKGQRLPESLLILPGLVRIQVEPIVRWRAWPRLGVQFDSVTTENLRQLCQFLESLKPVNA